jgi:DNA-binding GntR family transcriptional regulator
MIRADIMSGDLVGGDRLGETILAERYGLSRTPVREALRRLQSEGLVEALPHRGARVIEWRSLDIAAIYDMRAVVEGFLVRRAAVTMPDEEIDRLYVLCDEIERTTATMTLGDPDLIDVTAAFNREFHGSIARAAGGEVFAAVRNSIVIGPLVLRTVHEYTRDDQERSNRHHREILAAFRARSPDWAESVMLAHVYSAKSRLLEGQDPPGALPAST